MKPSKTFHWFRMIALAEGISFLVLLLIAMPLKHWAGIPLAVTIAGGLHGVLFIGFLFMLWEVKKEYKKSRGWTAKAFVSSFLPFGTIVLDKQWKREAVAG